MDSDDLSEVTGTVRLGDDVNFDFSEEELKGVNILLKYLKCRLRSDGRKPKRDKFGAFVLDGYGSIVYEECNVFSDEILACFLCSALSEFNMIPFFTSYTFADPVIKTLFSALSNSNFGPNLSEGFASILEIYPNNDLQLIEDINRELNSINQKIGQRKKKETQKTFHGYSRLLDLERLLYLIKLITFFPGLEAKDKLTKSKLEEICNPTPEGSMEEKASMLLKEWRGKCYSDINKIEEDLKNADLI